MHRLSSTVVRIEGSMHQEKNLTGGGNEVKMLCFILSETLLSSLYNIIRRRK